MSAPKKNQIERALKGLNDNVSGKNGPLHQFDEHLALVRKGDLVIPPEALTPEVRKILQQQLGAEMSTHTIGEGRELDIESQDS